MDFGADSGWLSRFAHQRAYPPFDAPCLTCHLVIRIGEREDPIVGENESEIDQRRCQRMRAINRLVERLDWMNPQARGPRRYAPPALLRADSARFWEDERSSYGTRNANDAMCLQIGYFGHFALHVIVEQNAEYTALSFRASAMRKTHSKCHAATLAYSQKAFEGIDALMSTALPTDRMVDPILDDIFHRFWDTYFGWLATNGEMGVSGEIARVRLFEALGDRIVEFQGVVLRTDFDRLQKQPTASDDGFAEGKEDLEKQLNFAERNLESGYDSESVGPVIQFTDKDPPREWLRKFVNDRPTVFTRILGFRRVPGAEVDRYTAGNAVLCHLYSNKAVYGSTLNENHHAVRYFIVYGGPSRHQLGRMVMALHHCGELRFASLFDSAQLSEASDRIRVLDLRLNPMRERASEIGLNQRDREITEISQLGRGGLSFRIAQTHGYQQRLDQHLRDLRIRRILGWQSYDGFVRRNVARRLDGIAEIGRRFDALQARFLQLSDVNRQQRVLQLQIAGEVFAIIASTYYFGAILYELAVVMLEGTIYHHAIDAWTHKIKVVCYIIGAFLLFCGRIIVGGALSGRKRGPPRAYGILGAQARDR